MIKVGVIFGGESVEHEVSIITAVQAMSFMDTSKYDVIPIYIDKNRNWYTGDCLKNMESYKNMAEIPFIAKEIANLKEVSYDSIVLNTTNNAKEFFNLID